MLKHLSTTWLFIAGVAVLALAGVPRSAPAHLGDASLIHACVNPGKVRIVGPDDACRGNETSLHWSITGPQGIQGPKGDEGPEGPQGEQGPAPADISTRVFNSMDITIPHVTDTILTFDSERWDTDGIHDTAANTSRLTAQTAGKYYIFAHIEWDGGAGTLNLRILLNDTTVIAENFVQSLRFFSMSIGTHYEFNAGDYVEVQVRQNSGVPRDILSVEASSPEFGMVKLP